MLSAHKDSNGRSGSRAGNICSIASKLSISRAELAGNGERIFNLIQIERSSTEIKIKFGGYTKSVQDLIYGFLRRSIMYVTKTDRIYLIADLFEEGWATKKGSSIVINLWPIRAIKSGLYINNQPEGLLAKDIS